MTRLLLVNPNTNTRTTALMAAIAQRAAPAGVTVEGTTAATGAPLLDDPAKLAEGALAVRALVGATDLSAYAGVVVAAFGDPGLAESRAATAVPLTGIAEAAMAEAAALGRFVIVTTTGLLKPSIDARVAEYGHGARHAGTFLTPGDAATLMTDPARLEAALEETARRALVETGADAIIIGGGPLAAVAEALRPRFAVPIIEPVPAAVRLALSRAITPA
ncbi:aspartate/glutamate racemase family protein [Falsiroseomonas stagni]|uniref:Asp/Glu/hydantoin racemase n=1 Tax=Falsiroseomonas stagni DSM 19981 TaxID=1123062 RepID=A0A1I4E9Z7_9PROT|nr:aspartate/glutamate racemase family protein [Falsiroseomonas stagni]SFL01437.1 Asp/Glu/hydantoin racemase [Falsiroseomonas stagni DSM 19981]